MTVSTIASLATGIGRTLGNQNAKTASSVKQLVSADVAASGNQDVASISTANALQLHVTALRTTTQTMAQASAMAQVAQGGTTEISRNLSRMEELADQANDSALSDDDRMELDNAFQLARKDIARIASQTRFGGQPLLDGSLTSERLGLPQDTGETFAIGDLSDTTLLGADTLSLTTPHEAKRASEAVAHGQSQLTTALAALADVQDGVDFAFTSLEVAASNQEAAASTLSDADFIAPSPSAPRGQWQADGITTLLTQTNKLPQNILQLLSE